MIKLADPGTWFIMYQNDEIDFMQKPAPADLLVAQSDFPDQIYSSVGDFRTYYIFFDVTQPPFDKLEVRQAFSHAIDRDAIQQQILGPAGQAGVFVAGAGIPGGEQRRTLGNPEFRPGRGKAVVRDRRL